MLRFAILELLSHKPLSGYALKKRFGGSIVFFWRARHGQIYRVYAITAEGFARLVEWLRGRVPLAGTKDEMMLKCFAFHLLPPEEAIAQIAGTDSDA